MDAPCSFEELRSCLRSIASVNRLTFAHTPTLAWLDQVLRRLPTLDRPLKIVDVGCGYGDLLRKIAAWAAVRKLPVVLTGLDLNLHAVRAAREATGRDATGREAMASGRLSFVAGNAFDFRPEGGIDLIVSSLLTHHLEDAAIVKFLHWMEATARVGWFVNDLHRQRLAYHGFRMLSRWTRWHPFVKHDGPVSIRRSFRRADWHTLCKLAALPRRGYVIRAHRPARLCVARAHMVYAQASDVVRL